MGNVIELRGVPTRCGVWVYAGSTQAFYISDLDQEELSAVRRAGRGLEDRSAHKLQVQICPMVEAVETFRRRTPASVLRLKGGVITEHDLVEFFGHLEARELSAEKLVELLETRTPESFLHV